MCKHLLEPPNKNLLELNGLPLLGHVIKAAKNAKLVKEVFVTTDCPLIEKYGKEQGCHIIRRPPEVRGDINHGIVIKHAVDYVDNLRDNVENVVILLGNSVMLNGKLIDKALKILREKKDIDSVMSVWKAVDDHPYRALQIKDGLLVPHGLSDDVHTSRQTYPDVFFYDQGVWAFRKECVYTKEGPRPWWWMGKKCHPIIRNWVGGRDIHNALDLAISEWWLSLSDEEIERLENL